MERYDYSKQCKIPVALLPSDILRLSEFFGMKPFEVIATFCSIVTIEGYIERLRRIGIEVPKVCPDLKIYSVQIKAKKYCIFYGGENCRLPPQVRPRRCIAMSDSERRAYEAEKHAFYLELAELVSNVGSVEKALELYFEKHTQYDKASS